jgi:lysozyme
MAIPQECLEFICKREGYLKPIPDGSGRVVPYLCPAGVPTIGFGSIFRLDGSRVAMTDPPIDMREAMALMQRELMTKCEPAVDRMITTPLHPLSRGALVSFVYNCGAGALRSSNLRKAINAKDWGRVPSEFMKWRLGGGRVLRGLELRRQAEAQMFLRGVNELRKSATQPAPVVDDWGPIVIRRAA